MKTVAIMAPTFLPWAGYFSMIKNLNNLTTKGKKDHICLLALQGLGSVYNSETISLFQRPNTKLEHGHCLKEKVT